MLGYSEGQKNGTHLEQNARNESDYLYVLYTSNLSTCQTESMNGVICSPTVTGWSATADEFSLLFENNPLAEFVELPDSCYNLRYSNILCGAIKGALEMVSCKRIS